VLAYGKSGTGPLLPFYKQIRWTLFVPKRKFTKAELSYYNGRDGRAAFIAFDGLVYDVSQSYQWRDGRHQVLHAAGTDLTREMDGAPHGADLLALFPIVGVLSEI
jgi:predicted heme/steroid binding protein